VPQKNQYLKEMNKIKIKDNIIANIEKTIKRLEEENSAAKRSIAEMQQVHQMKKGNICHYARTIYICLVSIFLFSTALQIRTNRRMYLP